MEKRVRKLALGVVMLIGFFPGTLLAFEGAGSGTGLLGNLDTYGMTKEDLRREKPNPDASQYQEAAETGTLETTRDEPSSTSTETGGGKDSPIDPWP